jgi:prepilin-type N-terminal cleavage/methylation domain-containing protein
MPTAPHSRATHGFTLLELMVSLTIGGVAITSIYAVGSASTRAFHQQQQIATLQSSLRIALGQVKRDIARAGYLSTPNVGAGMACAAASPGTLHEPAGNGSLAAISRFDRDFCSNSANGCSNLNGATSTTEGRNRASLFTADSVVLMANYETAYEYPLFGKLDGGGGVTLSPDSHAYRTDFGTWYTGAPNGHDTAAFADVFRVNRLVRIRTSKGFHHFALITGTNAGSGTVQPEVRFAPAIPANCAGDVASEAWIAPVSAIRYYPRNEVNPNPAFGPMAQLVREEVDPTAKLTALFANPPARVVLDYVVAFRLGFVTNGATAPGLPDDFTPGDATGAVNANPERVRAVHIDLAARTPEQDERFPWSAENCDPDDTTPDALGRCFQVFSDRPGAARVRAVHAEVFLPNVAYEGY